MSKEEFTFIKDLIKAKRYDEARQRLMPLSEEGHPLADKWLARLDDIAPAAPPAETSKAAEKLDRTIQEKAQRRHQQQGDQKRRIGLGCMLRGCLMSVTLCACFFLLPPMLLLGGLTSNNAQARQMSIQVLTFVEEQQEYPIARAVTNLYVDTSGTAMRTVLEPRRGEICDLAMQRARDQGQTITRAQCEEVLDEAMNCVTDDLPEAETCLRRYLFNRCLQEVGNTAEGQAYCRAFVEEHMGATP